MAWKIDMEKENAAYLAAARAGMMIVPAGMMIVPVKRPAWWSIFSWLNDWLCRKEIAERMRLNEKLRRAAAQGFADNRPPAPPVSESGVWNEATWLIKVNENHVEISRLHEGKTVEGYRYMSHAEAAV